MDEKYFPQAIEEKWQAKWAESRAFEVVEADSKPKFYSLEMLPYPSGYLHMGHVRNYSIGDALAWYKRLKGFNVLHPIGWDSFGQPAEQAAIKRGVDPRQWTEENIEQMRGQLKRLGISYDWSREIAAHRPEYYKFDQWFFLKMLERGLAYKKDSLVNWCPNDSTILSNEQASGGICWRCGFAVEKKNIQQWFLKITAYAEQLLDDMTELEGGWAEKVLTMQRNWIGKSAGAFVEFEVRTGSDSDRVNFMDNPVATAPGSNSIRVFTTRIDTIYGANAIVVAAEHPLIENHFAAFSPEIRAEIEQIKVAKMRVTDVETEPEKIGVDTGLKAINPFSLEEIPIWAANYVLIEYGTGAVMSVPAHDERDFEFAEKYDLPIKPVINRVSNSRITVKNSNDGTEMNLAILAKVKDLLDEINATIDGLRAVMEQTDNIPDEVNEFASQLRAVWQQFSELTAQFNNLTEEIDFLLYQFDAPSDKTENDINEIAVKMAENRQSVNEMQERFDRILARLDSLTNHEKTVFSNRIKAAMTEYGVLTDSGEWSGETSADAKREMTKFAEENGFGEAATTYRLRDWGISRQRFWGAPIPIVYCETCGVVPVPVEQLPIRLPENVQITGTGESPLAGVPEFVNTVCPTCDQPAKRETDTMDTFVDSCWYYFRYLDPHNCELPFAPEKAAYWMPIDQYIGGVDHAVMHLMYTRFWTKVMRDIGLVTFNEPVKRLLTQGMVVGETFFDDASGKAVYYPKDAVKIERDQKGKLTGARLKADGTLLKFAVERMSKSKGNGVNPDEMIEIYGADAARLYTLFSAPVENELVWNDAGIEGAVRFIQRVYRFVWRWQTVLQKVSADEPAEFSVNARDLRRKTHQTIQRVESDFERLQLNTPVAALMELSNALGDVKTEPGAASRDLLFAIKEAVDALILMLAPYAPHAAEEMFAAVSGSDAGILGSNALFPEFKAELAQKDQIEIPVQVNGKLRSRVFAAPDAAREELESLALADEKAREFTHDKQIVKVVVVPNRLVNIVVK